MGLESNFSITYENRSHLLALDPLPVYPWRGSTQFHLRNKENWELDILLTFPWVLRPNHLLKLGWVDLGVGGCLVQVFVVPHDFGNGDERGFVLEHEGGRGLPKG